MRICAQVYHKSSKILLNNRFGMDTGIGSQIKSTAGGYTMYVIPIATNQLA